jgi:sec-independent protein translocase protein TatA
MGKRKRLPPPSGKGLNGFAEHETPPQGAAMDIGPSELFLILLIVLFIFGPSRVPEIGASLGKAIREFRDALSGNKSAEKPRSSE